MQVLSQLSYNPTIGPLIGTVSGATRPVSRLLDGRVRRSPIAGLHHPGSLQIDGQRLLLPRQRVPPQGTTIEPAGPAFEPRIVFA
jgi:hypothetical protein